MFSSDKMKNSLDLSSSVLMSFYEMHEFQMNSTEYYAISLKASTSNILHDLKEKLYFNNFIKIIWHIKYFVIIHVFKFNIYCEYAPKLLQILYCVIEDDAILDCNGRILRLNSIINIFIH